VVFNIREPGALAAVLDGSALSTIVTNDAAVKSGERANG
jgi:hypothetical protein